MIESIKSDVESVISKIKGIDIVIQKEYIIKAIFYKQMFKELFEFILKSDTDEIKKEIDNLKNSFKDDEKIKFDLLFEIDDYKILKDICLQIVDKNFNKDNFLEVYEYLLILCSTNGGKFSGEFYTPKELSEFLTSLATTIYKDKNPAIYDPTCGNGSLLIGALKQLPNASIYGQEVNKKSVISSKIALLLNDKPADIRCGDTLKEPLHLDKKFNIIISNPPYSVSWDNESIENKFDPRFNGLLAPKTKADWAFIQHCLYHLADDGVLCVVVFPGILYRGGAEQKIRQFLVEQGMINAIISLPENIFNSTSIATNIIVFSRVNQSKEILFIDGSKDYETKGKLNILRPSSILETFKNRSIIKGKSNLVHPNIIEKNDYNLSLSQYVQEETVKEKIDILELNKMVRELRESNNNKMLQLDKFTQELQESLNG